MWRTGPPHLHDFVISKAKGTIKRKEKPTYFSFHQNTKNSTIKSKLINEEILT